MFFSDDGFFEYNLSTWTSQKVNIATVGDIYDAQWSPNHQWLAFQDDEGLKLKDSGMQTVRVIRAFDAETRGTSFEIGNRYLAYSDEIGLQIFDLTSHEMFTLRENEHSIDPDDTVRFAPEQWSPDGEWLWADVLYYEDQGRLLYHVPSRKVYEFSACNWYLDWAADKSYFITSVTYSGYSGCGCEDGIFRVNLRKDHRIRQKRIFQDSSGCHQEARATHDLRLSPDEQQIAFIQVQNPDWDGELDHLMVMNADGSNPKELVTSDTWLGQPIWSANGTYIVYVIYDEPANRVMRYSLIDGKSIELFHDTDYIKLSDPIDGSEWMMIHTEPLDDTTTEGLYIINILSQKVVRIENFGSHWIRPVRSTGD